MQLNRLATNGEARRRSLSRYRLVDRRAVHLAHLTTFLADKKLRVVALVRTGTTNESVEAVYPVNQAMGN